VAEDDEAFAYVVNRHLTEHGYKVLTARDGAAALEMSRSEKGPICLLLTDVNMPIMNGVELAAHVRIERPLTLILFMSAEPQVVAVIQKSFDLTKLIAAIDALIGESNRRFGQPEEGSTG
jgi:DNA-binding response OmpR family regulator